MGRGLVFGICENFENGFIGNILVGAILRAGQSRKNTEDDGRRAGERKVSQK